MKTTKKTSKHTKLCPTCPTRIPVMQEGQCYDCRKRRLVGDTQTLRAACRRLEHDMPKLLAPLPSEDDIMNNPSDTNMAVRRKLIALRHIEALIAAYNEDEPEEIP